MLMSSNLSSKPSVASELRALASPPKKLARAPKMPKLELNAEEDNIDQVNVRDFIRKRS